MVHEIRALRDTFDWFPMTFGSVIKLVVDGDLIRSDAASYDICQIKSVSKLDYHNNTKARYAFGSIFIFFNLVVLCISISQLYRSRYLFAEFSLHKNKLRTRLMNTATCLLMLSMAFVDIDFWLYYRERADITNAIYIYWIINKALIDIMICITGSVVAYSLIHRFFSSLKLEFPRHVSIFWYGIAISFTLLVVLFVAISFVNPPNTLMLVSLYSDIRLVYFSIAAAYVAYTLFVIYQYNQVMKKYKRNAILLSIFSLASFAVGVYWMVWTLTEADFNDLQDVVTRGGGIEKAEEANSIGQYAGSFAVILVGWAGYWVIVIWYMSFVWMPTSSVDRRRSSAAKAVAMGTPSSP